MIGRLTVSDITYRRIKGKSGKTWLVSLVPEAAAKLYVTNNPGNTTGKGGGYGFGGAIISFTCDDGEQFDAHGPWHSNAESLFDDTGLDVRHLHLTRVTVCERREFEEGSYKSVPAGEIYYREEVPAMGTFHRGKGIAQALADLYGKTVMLLSESNGGSSFGPVAPNHD